MITNVSIKELSLQQLRMETKIMADILNKRLRRLEKEGIETSSVFYEYTKKYARQGKEFIDWTKKGQVKYITGFKQYDREQMIKIYKAMRKAMSATTSTVSGTKKATAKKAESLKAWFEDTEIELNTKTVNDINDFFKTARENGFLRVYGSDTAMEMIKKGKTVEEVKQRMQKINDISAMQAKGQLPNKQVIKAMTLNAQDFQKWLDQYEVRDYTQGIRRTSNDVIKTDEQRDFDKLSKNVAKQANKQTKEENEIAKISKKLKKNI